MNSGEQGGAGSNKTMSFGKSRAKILNPTDKTKVTFNDVAGVDAVSYTHLIKAKS